MALLKRQVFKYGFRASYALPLQRGLAMSISFRPPVMAEWQSG
jgi:hypothetical protein